MQESFLTQLVSVVTPPVHFPPKIVDRHRPEVTAVGEIEMTRMRAVKERYLTLCQRIRVNLLPTQQVTVLSLQ